MNKYSKIDITVLAQNFAKKILNIFQEFLSGITVNLLYDENFSTHKHFF